AERWFQANNVLHRGGPGDGSIGLGADRRRTKIRGNAVSRTGTRSPGGIAQVVCVDRIPTPRAPPYCERVDRNEAAEVCPFSQICFAKNDGARLTQSANDD